MYLVPRSDNVFFTVEGGGVEMEVSYARTNWEALMQHINDSIR